MRDRLLHALANPCSVLQDPEQTDQPMDGRLTPYQTRAWNQFGCGAQWFRMRRETKLHIVGLDGRFVVRTIEMN